MLPPTRRSLVLGAGAMAASLGSVSARSLPEGRAAALDALLTSLTSLGMFNGVITIDVADEVVFRRAYGLADYELGTRFSPRARFKVASISKAMTDGALAALLAREALRFDDPLARFMPNFPGADRITIELITRHRSGIPHTNEQPWGDGTTILSHDEILARLAQTPLDFEPGAQRKYSNGGYAVLARVMEMAHGAPYADLMRELVFALLDMRDSGAITDSARLPSRLARGWQPGVQIGQRAPARHYAAETRPGGGSLYASARDVMTYFKAAWRGRLPGARAYPSLFGGTGATRAADGRSPGYYMDVHYDAGADMIVASTANNYAAEFRWAENLALIALGRDPLFASLPQRAAGRAAPTSHPWIGVYRNDNGAAFNHEISRTPAGDLILTDHDDRMARAIIPLAEGRFLDPLYYGVLRDDAAQPSRIISERLYPGGYVSGLVKREN